MLRPSLTTAAIALLCTGAMAQTQLNSGRYPITSPIRNAGVYHVATGTWTRNASSDNLTTKRCIYNNTCTPVYFTRMRSGDEYSHRSEIPSPSAAIADSLFYGTVDPNHRWDKRPGCAEFYTITEFEFAYCSSSTSDVTWQEDFASSYTLCGGGPMTPQYTFLLTGLPGGGPASQQRCWIVTVDLQATTPAIILSADGDGTYDPANKGLQQFGWHFNPGPTTVLADFTGPIITGDFTWQGGPFTGPLIPCTGTDGSWWDNPINLGETGTGMNSNDFFRIDGTNPNVPSGPGCYFFGGTTIHSDFWLKLFAKTDCPEPDPCVQYCFPNVAGVRSCPCGNQQVPALGSFGCNNFGPTPAGGTGGATLDCSGSANDGPNTTLEFHVGGQQASTNITILFIGRSTIANGVASGAGVRCVGTLQAPRPYKGNATPTWHATHGDPAAEDGPPHNPHGGSCIDFGGDHAAAGTTDAYTRSGSPVATTKYYYAAYRNSKAGDGTHLPCTSSNAFNTTNAVWIVWP